MATSYQVTLRSPLQILGDLVRTILSQSDLTDVSPNSTLATLLEAIAASQYEISLSSLKILQSTDLESLVGTALDKKAQSIRLPNTIGGYGRKPANQSSGQITVGSAFVKKSSKLYSGKPAPFAGTSTLFLEDASSFPATGKVYLARGTLDRFEGPIAYSSVTNSGTFWVLTLTSGLTKSHLSNDLVVVAQGGDRTVPAGTIVQVPANSSGPAIQYSTSQDLLIPDGESTGTIGVVCTQFGEAGNALAGAIKEFTSSPFSGATVTNASDFANGKSTESDEDLRQRIKNYPSTLSRGTEAAILAAIIGASDPTTGRTIQSAVVLEPVEPGDYARVYIDDGTGLEPTFGQQAYEELLASASGQEVRFRTAQFPITPSVAIGANSGPFIIQNGQSIVVHVDELVETYTITGSNYSNLNAASGYEIVRDLNSQSNIVGWRTANNGTNIVMIDLSGTGETMRVESGTLQGILGLPTAMLRPIFLYKDSVIQSFRGYTATLTTRFRNQWNLTAADLSNVQVIVDGVTQTISITDADFLPYQSNIASATIAEWAAVLSKKIAGVHFTVSGQVLVWSTWQSLSASGSLQIPETRADGTPATWVSAHGMWTPSSSGGVLSSVGSSKNFQFNRFTGEINFLNKPAAGDVIEVGSNSTRAHLRTNTTSNGLYDLSPITATTGNSRLVLGFDGSFQIRTVTVSPGDTITPTIPDSTNASNVIRLTASDITVFEHAVVGDWLYLIKDASSVPSWGSYIEGFYRLNAVGLGKFSTNQTYTSLTAVNTGFTNVTASTLNGRTTVTITATGHGLSTGDLITVTASASIGGISLGNLSVVNSPIIVIDSNSFQYTALAAATSDFAGATTMSVNTNIVKVTHAANGFSSGALITVVGAAPVTSSPIQFYDTSTYLYRATTAQTPGSIAITSVTYISDTWIEFEVSTPQLAAWSAILNSAQTLTSSMVYIFQCTTQPQLVDFGNAVSTLTVDQVVAAITYAIATGEAAKITPQQLEIRSADYATGTVAVLASIGNASSMISTGTSSSQQAHVGYSASSKTQFGFPVVRSIVLPTADTAGYGTQTYLLVDRDLTDIVDRAANPTVQSQVAHAYGYPEGFEHLWLTGREAGLTARIYNNQTSLPYTGLMRGAGAILPVNEGDTAQTSSGSLDRYSNYGLRFRDMSFNNYDKLVVEMNLNPIDGTVPVQLSKLATISNIDAITGGGMGQVISFELSDPDNSNLAFFDATSVYKAFDFRDFKLLTKSVGLYRADVSDRALIVRSADFGGNHRLKLSIQLPTSANQATSIISHSNDYRNGEARLTMSATLPSRSLTAGSVVATGTYKVQSTANGTLFDWRVTAGSINPANQYVVGNVLNISGASNLAGSYTITGSTYNAWAGSIASVNPSSSTITVAQAGHGYQDGDLVTINASSALAGISVASLSGTFPITYVDANHFTYTATSSSLSNLGTITSVTRPLINLTNSSVLTTNGSAVVTVTAAGHGLQTGNLVNTTANAYIAGISSAHLTLTNTPVTYLSSSQFSFVAGSSASALTMTLATATTNMGSGSVQVHYPGHGLTNYDVITVTPASDIGGITLADLSVIGAAISVADGTVFSFNANNNSTATSSASGVLNLIIRPMTGIIATITRPSVTYTALAATTTFGSTTVQLVHNGHAFNTGDLISTSASSSIGGISAANLTEASTAVTYIDANTFSYNANLAAPASTGALTLVTGGSVTVKSPGSGGLSPSSTYNAAAAPVQSWPLVNTTLTALAAAITAYNPTFPVATAAAIGSNLTTTYLTSPTYVSYPNAVAYSGTDMQGAFAWHSFSCNLSGSAGIWQYDPTSVKGIKATVQSIDPIFPTTTVAAGTSYSPIGEQVYIVPTNTKSLSAWLNFNAASSLNLLANVERIRSDDVLQISAQQEGSAGAVKVTGVTANAVASSVIGNASTSENSIVLDILTADAKTLVKNTAVLVTNQIASELHRPYRLAPTNPTSDNTTTITTFFRQTNSLRYIRKNATTGRLIFLRNGMGPLQSEPLSPGNTVHFTNLSNGLVQVTSTGGVLSARVGDMMYIQPNPSSLFTIDQCCNETATNPADGTAPTYLGFPVVHVIDSNNITIIAPSITNFNTVTLASSTDLIFMPAIWNEKNIRTNRAEGTNFNAFVNNGKAYYLVKSLGSGLVSVWLQNSSAEATDDMKLNAMSVGTDDLAIFGTGFDPSNQGTFRIVAHNGRNHLIVYNPGGGKDEIINSAETTNGGTGDRKWRVGPLNNGDVRPLRILAGESVQIGDKLRFSTQVPGSTSQWFNSSFFGSWAITGIGYQAVSYPIIGTAMPASVSTGSGVVTVTLANHGLTSGTSVTITTASDIGGILAANLSGTFLVTYVNANTFSYTAASHATSTTSGIIAYMTPLPFNTSSGTGDVTKICPFVEFTMPAGAPLGVTDGNGNYVDAFLIGINDVSIGFTEGTPFSSVRMVAGHGVNPQNAQNTDVFLVPSFQSEKMASTFGTIVTAMGKAGYSEQAHQGIDGYKIFTGLPQLAHRIIDSLPTNTVLYPGVKAAGAIVEVLPPLIKSIQVNLHVSPKDGVTINSISDLVKSTVASYINGLGVGNSVVLSEIVRQVQSLSGVYSVEILSTYPVASVDRITVGSIEKPFVVSTSTDISVG